MNGVVARSEDRVAAGARDDFAAWVAPSLLAMTRLARRLAPEADADDVVQDALVRAWQKRRLFDAARGTPTTWLLAITADRARAARRSRHRRLRLVDDAADVPEQPAHDPDRDVDEAIGALPPRQRLAVELHYYVGLSVAECAAVMGCSDGTVKSTLFDARANLRKTLGDRDAD
jgi:RNA polymerase sigma-70 factor (ECF subfamily)